MARPRRRATEREGGRTREREVGVTGFEYVTGLVSVLVGLALVDLAVSLQRLLSAGRRVRWDVLTPLAASVVTLIVIHAWWSFHDLFSDATTFQLGAFLPQLGSLLLLFLLAASVLPDEVPAEGLALADHYEARRVMIWGLLLAYVASAIALYVIGVVDGGASLTEALQRNSAGLVSLLVIAIPLFVRKRWVAGLVLGVALAALLASWLGRQIG